jgi:hypothetical protein
LHNVEEKPAHGVETAEASSGSVPVSRASWLRFVVPSVADLVFVLLLLALTLGALAKSLLGDAGIGWHIRTGELIRTTHAVPRVDPFSSIMQGKPWFAWEWLYDWVVGVLHAWAGLNGVLLLTGVVIALTFALVFRRMLMRGAHLPVAIVILLVALSASTIHFLARPHVVSWLLTVIWFGVLERFEAEGNWRRLAWLPATMVAWVNLHGGFLVGFALLGVYFVGNGVSRWTARIPVERAAAGARARAIAITGIVCALVTLANPYGYQLHVHIYRYLTDRFLMDHIDEFLSPNFHGVPQRCFALLVLLTVVGTAGARKKFTLSQLLGVLFAIYTGMYASRNIPISSILLAMIVAPLLSVALREMAGSREVSDSLRRLLARFDLFSARMAALDAGMAGRAWPALAVIALAWACSHQGWIGSSRVIDARFDDKRFPVRAVDSLAGAYAGDSAARRLPARGVEEAVFCPDRWGGYLIYRLYPGQRVAVDDRHDLYGTEFLKRYLKIAHGEPGWRDALAETRAGWALVPAESVLAGLLASDAKWTVAYRDDVAVLFRRIG